MKDLERNVGDGDRELMLYFDDELDALPPDGRGPDGRERRAAVVERLAHDEDARAKLAGLSLERELLRESADEDERGDDIADLVMAQLHLGVGTPAHAAQGREIERVELEDEPKIIELPRRHQLQPVSSERPAANDNARLLYGLAAMAAAVAIGLFVWGGSEGTELASLDDHAPAAPAAIEATPRRTADLAPAATAAATAEAPEERAVEVAAVDFGTNSGSVFYVSSGHQGATTAVVWVTDQGSEL